MIGGEATRGEGEAGVYEGEGTELGLIPCLLVGTWRGCPSDARGNQTDVARLGAGP